MVDGNGGLSGQICQRPRVLRQVPPSTRRVGRCICTATCSCGRCPAQAEYITVHVPPPSATSRLVATIDLSLALCPPSAVDNPLIPINAVVRSLVLLFLPSSLLCFLLLLLHSPHSLHLFWCVVCGSSKREKKQGRQSDRSLRLRIIPHCKRCPHRAHRIASHRITSRICCVSEYTPLSPLPAVCL